MDLLYVLLPVLVLVIQGTVRAEDCPALYARYSKIHTYCKPPNPSCTVLRSSVSQVDKDLIVKEHNNYRSKIASGQEESLPAASNMMEIEWDEELAAVAQKHASQCLFDHDCNNCRLVQNFGVGQNLAIGTASSSNIPEPDWKKMCKLWYDEIRNFNEDLIEPHVDPPLDEDLTYGHLTQLIWAKTWKVGCGYASYNVGNNNKQLYTCNYGPGGNMAGDNVYNIGDSCSACPDNSCCDDTCGGKTHFPGLCKITDDNGPIYKQEVVPDIMNCVNFDNQGDCKYTVEGKNSWAVQKTLSGTYLSITLKSGEESSLAITTPIKPTTKSACFVVSYRKGPNKDGDANSNTATAIFTIKNNDFVYKPVLPDWGADFRQQFSAYSMGLGWNMETQVKISFSVPAGKPEQFFEIKSFSANDGACKR